IAQSRGWPNHRFRIASWPVVGNKMPASESSAQSESKCASPGTGIARALGVIAHTSVVSGPLKAFELSSHQVLWETIHADLLRNPFSLIKDVGAYLTHHMQRFDISECGLDRNLFIEHLILPTYAQGVVRILLNASIPLRLFGQNWDQL